MPRNKNNQNTVSTITYSLIETPLAEPNNSRKLWNLEIDRSKEDGRILETRETYANEPHVREFREGITAPKTENNPVSTTGLIEHGEESSASTGVEIREENPRTVEPSENRRERVVFRMTSDRPRDFQNQRTRREENSQSQTNTSNYPSLFTIGLSLLILGIFGLALFCFAN